MRNPYLYLTVAGKDIKITNYWVYTQTGANESKGLVRPFLFRTLQLGYPIKYTLSQMVSSLPAAGRLGGDFAKGMAWPRGG